jgi:hypothetical protein
MKLLCVFIMRNLYTFAIRHKSWRLQVVLVILGLFALSTMPVFAQVTNATGTIQGTITDPVGATIPNVKVTLSEPSTGSTKVITTTGTGYYSAGSLVPGVYKVTAEAAGFSTLTKTFVVQVGVASNGDLKLNIGSTSTMVEVQANAVAVDAQQTQIAGILTQEQITNLPVNGRNFLDLAQLQPGVQIQDGTNFDPTKNGFESISFGGRFGRSARLELDGLDISDENVGTTTQNISQTAIQEFQVAQSNLDITTSITSSGSVNIVSRSGTNLIHGEGDYFFRDKRAGGADFPGGQNNYLQRNDVSGGMGGPIVPDKAFFFISAENYTQHLQAPVSLAGTPLAALSGSYSAPYSEMHLLGRTDFNLPHGAKAFIRGVYFNNKDVGGFGGGNNYSPYLNENNVPNVGGGIDFLTGNFSHSFRVGYFKFYNEITDATSVTQNPTFNLTPGINLQIGAFSSGSNLLAPQQTVQTNKQFKYDGSWTKRNHTLRYGAGFNRLLGGGFASFFGLQPQVALTYSSYAGGTTFPSLDGNPADYSSNPANYIVGLNPSGSAGITVGNGQGYDTEIPQFGYPGGGQQDWRVTAYIGDQWKATSRLNVNFGLRYIRDTGRTDSDLPAIPQLDAVGAGLGDKVREPNANFGPQAGIAWDLTGKGTTVIRLGGGLYYENNVWNNILFDRPVRLSQGLFFGDATVCPATSIPLSNGTTLTTIDGTATGTTIASLCSQPAGSVYKQIAELQSTYQAAVKSIGASSNGNYILNAMAVGANVNGDDLFLPQYKTPQSYQMNVGIQHLFGKNTVVTVDYLRNLGEHFLIGIDENHVGAARNYNATAAKAAVAATVLQCGVASVDLAIKSCPGINPISLAGATIGNFAANGLDSENSGGGVPNSTYAFGGNNPNFGQMQFLTPGGKSAYNALEVTVTQRVKHPLRGITALDLTGAYTYSHFSGTGTVADIGRTSGGDQDFAEGALSNDNPSKFYGSNSLDRHQQFSGSLGLELLKGFRIDSIAHLYSSLSTTAGLATQGGGDIFISDLDGDGTVGDVVAGSNVGSYMRQFNQHSINKLINSYNATNAGQLTPAGKAVVNSGVLTQEQLSELGGVQQTLLNAPTNQVGNDILRIWDIGASYNYKLGEALTIQPSVHAFNVLNFANFDAPGTLGAVRESGTLASNISATTGTINNTTYNGTTNGQDAYRVGLGTGVYAEGAPRQLEFALKFLF